MSIAIKASSVDQLTKVGTYCFELASGTIGITSSLLLTVYSSDTNNYFPVYGVYTTLKSSPVYGNAIIDNKRNQATVSITTSNTSTYLAVYTLFLNLDENLSGVYQGISYMQLKAIQAGGPQYELGFPFGSVVMKNSCEQ